MIRLANPLSWLTMGKKRATSGRNRAASSNSEYSIKRACEKARQPEWKEYADVLTLESKLQQETHENLFAELPQFHCEVEASGGARLAPTPLPLSHWLDCYQS